MTYSIDAVKYRERARGFIHAVTGLDVNLDDPRTIQEKLCWLNIYEPDLLKTKCADKIRLRFYADDVLEKNICVPLKQVYDSAAEINWSEIPERCVIKCNHGSGMNIMIPYASTLRYSDTVMMREKLEKWMSIDFAFQNGFEAHYHDIKHRILIEEYLEGGYGLHDYKFWCFNGEPKLYTINNGYGHGDIMYYKMDGTPWNLYGVPEHQGYRRPEHFDEMVEYSRKLAAPFKFVRCDFYEVDGMVYLGEMTFTPGACAFRYKKDEDNFAVGDLLTL